MSQIKTFPNGHFYSPVIKIDDVVKSQDRIWPKDPVSLGIDFNDLGHQSMLQEVFPKYLEDFDESYPDEQINELGFYKKNTIFSWLDSRALFVMLRHFKPKRMIEIGSGMSSLLTADVNGRFLNNQLNFTCIEPYPKEYLLKGIAGINNLVQEKVEEVSLSLFDELKAGDILFIDSSHVSKTGSDVNHIYFQIIPRLAAGVIIHIHDIFLPSDYPKPWVIKQARSWNEQYIVQALLMYTHAFEVVFGCSYVLYKHSTLLKEVLKGELYGGGSIWLRKMISS